MTGGALRSYTIAALAALLVSSVTFVRWRNLSFETQELGRARAAAEAVAHGETPLAHAVASGIVAPERASERYPFLRHRSLLGGRALGGPHAPIEDKLLYDAAMRAESEGPFARFLDDGSGRVVAAVPLMAVTVHGGADEQSESVELHGYRPDNEGPRGHRPPRRVAPGEREARGGPAVHGAGTAVVVSQPPGGPEPYPFLVVLGLLALGALIAAAGAGVGGAARAPGIALGASGLAVPAYLWGGPIPAAAIVLAAIGVAVADRRGLVARAAAEARRNRVAYTYLAPAAIGMLVLVAVPFLIGLVLGFYDHVRGEWHFVGLSNFADILSGGGRSFSDPLNFWFTLGVTVAWTAVNVALHVVIGVAMAMMLREPWLRARGTYRMLLILPWAIPNYITALIWAGMFQSEYGAVNALLLELGLDKVSWFSHWATAFTANVTTNTWLGFPFMMVVALGALESIPRDMYEAAEVDGATGWQRFRHITLPHLRPAMVPAIALGSIWTFNMFNVIYLVSNGRPGGGTDILVTEAYRWAFERNERYGMAAAYATLIFGVLLLWLVVGARLNRKEKPA